MKLYSFDNAHTDYMNITNNPFVGEIDRCVDLFDVVCIDGEYYTVSCLQNGFFAGVRKVVDKECLDSGDWEETYREDNIVCPVCRYENPDSFEFGNSGKYNCPRCNALLDVEVEYSVTYTANVVTPPNIIRYDK